MMDESAASNVFPLYLCKYFNSLYILCIISSFWSLISSGFNCCLLWQTADPVTLENQVCSILLIKCREWELMFVPLVVI